MNVQGAPNFRGPDDEGLNVYGVAQPTVPGLKSILTILNCQPQHHPHGQSKAEEPGTAVDALVPRRSSVSTQEQSHTIWFSTREETLGEYRRSRDGPEWPKLTIHSVHVRRGLIAAGRVSC